MIYYYVDSSFGYVCVDKDEYMSCLKHARKYGMKYTISVLKRADYSHIFLS